ncbi:uncharacterized protein LOC123979958 isoform X2 [Micropterus dolomieu]|uniref:uncharacterized protein LOC123979958 isoform X2 n=1 Tax=Micropterus dolomieu TaxID=147949 RepID=UPI001E8DE1D2|nr:uncharacterized protein LOC123979958 isoform X2 [Micropterus dolomieu]
MDILNLWNDDPEEVLLDLGFGCDEPDLSGRIPARFINHQSQARGINLQVFLETQKNRLDLENPDVSNRFRQLEVLQQVTTAFSSLVGSSSSPSLPPETRERRRQMGMLFRRASKKSLSQIHNHKTQDLTTPAATSPPCAAHESLQIPPSLADKKVSLKRVKPGLLETVCLCPLAEEQGTGPDRQPHMVSSKAYEALTPWPLMEGQPLTVSTFSQRKKSLGPARESFEIEEIHSFDECSVYTRGAENVQGVIRTNSCQSDSSGFLEEPFIPTLSQQASPGPDHIKALSVLSGGSKISDRPDSVGLGIPNSPTGKQKKEEEHASSLSFHSDKDSPPVPSSFILHCSKFDKGCPTLPCISPDGSIPFCQSTLSSQPHGPDCFIGPAFGRISDLTGQSISLQDRPCSQDDNTDPAPASPVQDVVHVKMGHLALDLEDTLQKNGNGEVEVEGERHTDTVQTREVDVYILDTESSAGLSECTKLVSEEVCNQTDINTQVPSCSLHDELSAETKPEEFRKVFQVEMDGTGSGSSRSVLLLHDKVPKDLIEIESLDMVFQTSVDGSEAENGDVDAFFEQLDTEGRVYWAEPIQVSNPTHVLEESGSFEASDGSSENSLLPRGQGDSFSSTGRAMSLVWSSSTIIDNDQTLSNATASSGTPSSPFPSSSATPDLKPSSCSVSVQMPSSLSSHIVHRKDVPYMTDSKCTLLPSVLPLDTSTPFRAVQSWTDRQIQRNTLTKKLSHGALHIVPNEVTVSTSESSEATQTPTLIFASSSSCPLLSNDWQSHDCLPGMVRQFCTMSVDKGHGPEEEEEVDRNGNEDEEKLWEGNQTANKACCCSCDHQCTWCNQKSYIKQHTVGNSPVSTE